MRELNAGDMAVIQDTVRILAGNDPAPDVKIGAMKLIMVERALVGWSLEVSCTPSSIRNLDPRVFEAIFKIINGGDEAATEAPDFPEEQSSSDRPSSLPTDPSPPTP